MTDVLTVTVNPVIDIHYFTEEFQAGRDNVVSCRKMFAAGKGMNVSRALQAFGISAEAFLLLGRENADEYLRLASGYGVKVSRILTDGSVRENISVNTPAGETRICTNDFSASPAALRELASWLRAGCTPARRWFFPAVCRTEFRKRSLPISFCPFGRRRRIARSYWTALP